MIRITQHFPERTSHDSAGWKTRIVGLLSAEYEVKKVKGVVKKKKKKKRNEKTEKEEKNIEREKKSEFNACSISVN